MLTCLRARHARPCPCVSWGCLCDVTRPPPTPNTVQQGERYRSAIVISSVAENVVSADRIQLADLDRRIDDASLETGNLRLGFRNYPVYVIEH